MGILLPSTAWMKHDTVFTFKLQQKFLISLAIYCKLRVRLPEDYGHHKCYCSIFDLLNRMILHPILCIWRSSNMLTTVISTETDNFAISRPLRSKSLSANPSHHSMTRFIVRGFAAAYPNMGIRIEGTFLNFILNI